MRIRRINAIFWSMCILVSVSVLYIVFNLGLNLPSVKPAISELDDSKWAALESKLKRIENELSQHHVVVGEIKDVIEQIDKQKAGNDHLPLDKEMSNNIQQDYVNQNKQSKSVYNSKKENHGSKEFKAVLKEPESKNFVIQKYNASVCPIMKNAVPKTDIQMLSMYERIMFDDIDGGVWKQGWDIDYQENQWSSKNKLKVFIIPHSHNDPGWLKTFEEYYRTQTSAILNNMVEKLTEHVEMKFIWAEISYLAYWWNTDANADQKAAVKKLLDQDQIEIVTGGWVMNDEANSHWLSIVQQLTTGHQWLLEKLNYVPKNSWSIDPFGHSSTQPYLLKLAGFEQAVIQRVHYRVKKELAMNRQLEFKWRQLWDGVGQTDLLTHMMPFYSYDAPHSCGPDPKVCCQFDFRRLPGNGMSCPWGIPPRKIVQKNVRERSSLILDQWRKKAQLYRSNVLLVPLGDDFRYDKASEWDQQYTNYRMIIDFINNNDAWNAEVQFGTLKDYFKELHKEIRMSEFPSLSGDFFTYADRNQHYWSGYFTSRPFYKNMDRVLLAYLRAAESITTQLITSSAPKLIGVQLRDQVNAARESLSLFQHHDGVTGTEKDHVREDYANKLLKAIKHCQSAIQLAAYHLLEKPNIQDQTQDDVYFDVDDIWRQNDELPTRITITLDVLSPSRKVVLYNALSFKRHEIVTVLVNNPNVEVYDPEGNVLEAQVSPVVAGETRLNMANNKFQLSFLATIGPLSLSVYTVALREPTAINKYTTYARVRVLNAEYWRAQLPPMFAVTAGELRGDAAAAAAAGRLVVTSQGLLKAVGGAGGVRPVHMSFVTYGTNPNPDNRSGAYLFIPDGPATELKYNAYPEIVISEGPLKASVYVAINAPKVADIILTMSIYNNPTLPQNEIEITNTLLMSPEADDVEVAMRFSTSIDNGDVFYTDLNGMQMIKRRYMDKIPLQANFYPLPAAAYLEDDNSRLTLLTSTPLGVAALAPGQIEIMQDRRLSKDDNRGINQGVLDNVRTRHTFRLIFENSTTTCQKPPTDIPSGQLSLGPFISQQFLSQPLINLHYVAGEETPLTMYGKSAELPVDVAIGVYRAHVVGKTKSGSILHGLGLTFQRVYLDPCYPNTEISKWYPVGEGTVNVTKVTNTNPDQVFDSSLTFVNIRDPIARGTITLCPMEIRSVFINHTTTAH